MRLFVGRFFIVEGISCDICQKSLLVDENVRYELRIEVRSAYDVMDITKADLDRVNEKEINKTLDEAKKLSQQETEDEVYKTFKFDLCLTCQREYIKDPLRLKKA